MTQRISFVRSRLLQHLNIDATASHLVSATGGKKLSAGLESDGTYIVNKASLVFTVPVNSFSHHAEHPLYSFEQTGRTSVDHKTYSKLLILSVAAHRKAEASVDRCRRNVSLLSPGNTTPTCQEIPKILFAKTCWQAYFCTTPCFSSRHSHLISWAYNWAAGKN